MRIKSTGFLFGLNGSYHVLQQHIAKSSDEQTIAISQISEAINQVSQVVQQNSATSEQSAAASQEMSGQAELLQQLISQFKLKISGDMAISDSSVLGGNYSTGFAIKN